MKTITTVNTIAEQIQECKEARAHRLLSAQDIVDLCTRENRTFTGEEVERIELLRNEAKEFEGEMAKLAKHDDLVRNVQADCEQLAKPISARSGGVPITSVPQSYESRIEFTRPYQVASLRAFTGGTRQENEERAYRSGKWLQAALFNQPVARRWCAEHGVELRSNNEGINSDGGALVPPEFASAIIDNRELYGVFRRYAKIMPMGRDTLSAPYRTSGLTAHVTGEGVAATESQLGWKGVQLTARKIAVLTLLSSELDEDAIINLVDTIAEEGAQALALLEDTMGFVGDGSADHAGVTGIVNKIEGLGSSYKSWVDVATATHDLFTEVDAADLSGLMGRLPEYAEPGAKFYCSRVAKASIFDRLMGAASGNNQTDMSGKIIPAYLGYPIVTSQVMNKTTTANNDKAMLLFGDLSKAAMLGDRRGIRLARSTERYFELDSIGLMITERVDVAVHSPGTTSEAGPMVALIGSTS